MSIVFITIHLNQGCLQFFSSHEDFVFILYLNQRCHRIGQQAKVRCLYIIAKGTLDEVLFLLIKKKFRDLGEFVEGKEEMEMVINKTYRDEEEAVKVICLAESNNDEDADGKEDAEESEVETFNKLINEDVFQHEIEELGVEQAGTIKPDDEDEDNSDKIDSSIASQTRKKSSQFREVKEVKSNNDEEILEDAGSSQQHAICLSDDEEEAEESPPVESQSISDILNVFRANGTMLPIEKNVKLPNTRMYYMYFDAPSYGFLLSQFHGRLLVTTFDQSPETMMTGDIIYSVNDMLFPKGATSGGVTAMRKLIATPPVRVVFARNEEVGCLFRENQLLTKARMEENEKTKNEERTNKSNGDTETIEILDDD